MILLVGNPGHGIHESHGFVVIAKVEFAMNRRMTACQCPIRHLLKKVMQLWVIQGRTAFADRLAMLFGQSTHARLFLEFVIGLVQIGDDISDLIFRPGYTEGILATMDLFDQGRE
jgi:hypothetical protein